LTVFMLPPSIDHPEFITPISPPLYDRLHITTLNGPPPFYHP
jgi:hypothetical protein